MFIYPLIVYIATLAIALDADRKLDNAWNDWKSVHNKVYNKLEERARRLTWEKSVAEVAEHNMAFQLELVDYELGLNEFSDMEWKEFQQSYLSSVIVTEDTGAQVVSWNATWTTLVRNVPDELDWRDVKGVVTSVRTQGKCAAPYAFSLVGAIEGQYNRKMGTSQEFSEQQIIDCSKSFGNKGCLAGSIKNSHLYVAQQGIEAEGKYPYTEKEGVCQYNKQNVLAFTKDITELHSGDETELKNLVATIGPVTVALYTDAKFKSYKGGILNNPACKKRPFNTILLLIGYGSEEGLDFWILKNSWGTKWGENGFIRLARNKGDMCGIADFATAVSLK